MDDGVFVWHMDVPYENSRPARGPGAKRRACRLGCVSLILSLHKQRKNAPAASGTLHEKEDPSRKAIEQSVIVDVGTVARRVEIATPWPLTPTPLSHRDFLRSPQGEGLEAASARRASA